MLRPFEPGDVRDLLALHARYAADDRVDPRSTLDSELNVGGLWAATARDAAGAVVGWGALRSWTEDDGTRVNLTDGYVAPPARRQGLGTRLLTEAEAHREEGAVLAGNASEVQPDRAALLERAGYRHVFSVVEMEHAGPPPAPRPLPGGVTVRSATPSDAKPLLAVAKRAWAGRPYTTLPVEDRFAAWLRRSDLSLFQVATVGDRIVGFVAVTPAEVEDVLVDPGFGRRGLATALLTRALAMVPPHVRLHTEAHGPATALYERLGFRVIREHRRYRKRLAQISPIRSATESTTRDGRNG